MLRSTRTLVLENGALLEYTVVGIGTPILLFHGGHSNCHEKFGYKNLLEQGYSIITPSRAGYGSTSKEPRKIYMEACFLLQPHISKFHSKTDGTFIQYPSRT